MPDLSLSGRVAFVTGGDSGIGAACVAALAAAGADVAIGYRDHRDQADAAVKVVEALGRRAAAVGGDVGDPEQVEAAFDQIEAALGIPDILVNSAGRNMSEVSVADMTTEQWRGLMAADLDATFFTSRRFVRHLLAAERPGAIVNITSVHAFAVRAGGADYVAAKAGQTGFTRTLAIEVAGKGITVNAVAPGMILTPMNARAMADGDYRRELESHIPAGRAGKPEDVAGVAVFLASSAGSYITGAEIVVDGGLSLVQATGA